MRKEHRECLNWTADEWIEQVRRVVANHPEVDWLLKHPQFEQWMVELEDEGI